MKRPCIAFKMNYCDGGKDDDHFGYRGICTPDVMKKNIKAGRPWCSNDDCDCKKYFDGRISSRSFSKKHNEGYFPCGESVTLENWEARSESGCIAQNPEGHLCILTTRKPTAPENERFVFAMFIVHELFDDEYESGKKFSSVSADEYFRLEFRPHEAEQINFWKIFPKPPKKLTWGQNWFKYFDDATAVKFLERAVEVKRGTPKEDFAKEFLKQYPYK